MSFDVVCVDLESIGMFPHKTLRAESETWNHLSGSG